MRAVGRRREVHALSPALPGAPSTAPAGLSAPTAPSFVDALIRLPPLRWRPVPGRPRGMRAPAPSARTAGRSLASAGTTGPPGNSPAGRPQRLGQQPAPGSMLARPAPWALGIGTAKKASAEAAQCRRPEEPPPASSLASTSSTASTTTPALAGAAGGGSTDTRTQEAPLRSRQRGGLRREVRGYACSTADRGVTSFSSDRRSRRALLSCSPD